MRAAAASALLLLLAACSGGQQQSAGNVAQPQDLENAAIARGMIRDPGDTEITGLYARDTDRVCIVPARDGHRIGAYVDYGEGITCSATGTVSRVGDTLHITLGDKQAPDSERCGFDAVFDGDSIAFPGALPQGCAKFCAKRAAFTGLHVARMSESSAEASAMRDAAGRRLCGD